MKYVVRPARRGVVLAAVLAILVASAPAVGQAQGNPFVFRDVTEEVGLLPSIGGILAHGAGWGDATGNGWIDFYVGTFHQAGGTANKFYRNEGGRFVLDADPALQISTRANGALFVDLNNNGLLDLYVTSMPNTRGGITNAPATLFRNDGNGKFTNISAGNAACPPTMAARSAAALDFDGDGLLDLVVVEDRTYAGRNARASTRIFRNMGNLQFQDVSQAVGLPAEVAGYGVAAGDLNNDGWPDFMVAGPWGVRLFINDGKGRFRETTELAALFDHTKMSGGDPTGVAFGDVNRDGLLDVVIGQHFKTPWITPVALELFINRGVGPNGVPRFERVSGRVGLVPIGMKAPHVEIQDFDNDGWPDIYASVVKWARDGSVHPLIYRNLGLQGRDVRFREYAMGVNDFPTAEDRNMRGTTGPFFDKMLRERKVFYGAPGPTGDYDNDGRLDIFIGSFWTEAPSMLLRNETRGGNWVRVKVEGPSGVNRQGIGSRVSIYQAGRAGEEAALLGAGEIAAGYGYCSSQVPQAHFGLGEVLVCDVVVTLPHGKGQIVQKGVNANQTVTIRQE